MIDGYSQRNRAHNHGILGLWWNWTIGVGSLTAVIFLGMLISKVWLPLVAFGIDIALLAYVRRNRVAEQPVCCLIQFIAMRAMFWSAAIMVAINFMNTHWFPHDYFDSQFSNPSIPYITILIVAPVTMLVTIFAILRGRRLNFCAECRMRHGSSVERGLLGNIFSQEASFQMRVLFWMSLGVSIVSWLYYAFCYINTDINRPDSFFFRWVPVLLFAGTLGYFGVRYVSLWQYYCQTVDGGADWGHGRFTLLRYIVMWKDSILLVAPDCGTGDDIPGDMRLDTPVKIRLPYRERMTAADSMAYFRNLSNMDDVRIRFMYLNTNFNTDSNIFHYACFVDAPDLDGSRLKGEWYTLPQIQCMSGENRVAPALTAEINRIYTVSMAWKTYDRKGRRLYDIKHYRPTFRLRDFPKWDVDLNDPNWLFVAQFNEDSRFYRLKRLWRKYVNGIGE